MHPSKVTLRPKVRRPMAWDPTKSAPSVQQPEPSTQCPISGGYRRAGTRHHRIHYPDLLRTARRKQTPSRAILHAIRRTRMGNIAWVSALGPRGGVRADPLGRPAAGVASAGLARPGRVPGAVLWRAPGA